MRWLQKHHLQKQNLSLTRKRKQSLKQLAKEMSLSQQQKLIRLKKEVQPDVPKNTEKTLKPKEIKFNSWEELLKWEPGAREDDAINRSSVALASRRTGHLVNEKASKEAKVQALSNTNSKAKDHASVGGEEFKAYAFDYWQYLDSMVFWEGLTNSLTLLMQVTVTGSCIWYTLLQLV